jgi:hypothetical protein
MKAAREKKLFTAPCISPPTKLKKSIIAATTVTIFISGLT